MDGRSTDSQYGGMLTSSFHDTGKCFRIGGDEFAVILKGEREELQGYLYQLRNEIIDKNINKQSFLSASWGLAFPKWIRKEGVFMRRFSWQMHSCIKIKQGKKAEKKIAREFKENISL